jgi:outer membrane protein assembly factor BamB
LARAQRQPAVKPKPDQAAPLTLATDPAIQNYLADAEHAIKARKWADAARLLQQVLNARNDVVVSVKRPGPNGKEVVCRTGGWAAARRLLATMPAQGLAAYRKVAGPWAADLLELARDRQDTDFLARIARRFPYTEAGTEALRLLGSHYLDFGHAAQAVACYERLLEDAGAAATPPLLYQAALAYLYAGDHASAARTRKALDARIGTEGLRLGERKLSTQEVRQTLDKAARVNPAVPPDWPMVGGNPARSAQGNGGTPILQPRWRWSTIHDEVETTIGQAQAKHADTEVWVKMALDAQERLKQPVLPGFCPIAIKGRLFYRSHGGLVAIWLNAGPDAGGQHTAGELAWKAILFGALTHLLGEPIYKQVMNEWQGMYRQNLANLIIENSAPGTLSTDSVKIFLIEELGILPHPVWVQERAWLGRLAKREVGWPPPGDLNRMIHQNVLQAYDVESGKLIWELPDRNKPGSLAGTHFLGAPLPSGRGLYALNEKKGEFRLLCLDPNDNGRVFWTQPLAAFRDPITSNVFRRAHPLHLAYSNGVLICPTGAGTMLGVDLLTRGVLWSYSYQENPLVKAVFQVNFKGRPVAPMALPVFSGFHSSPPVIQNGKVVFAAPDADSVHCVSLRDGMPLWSVQRGDDLYLAGVHAGRVLLVGKNGCRALDMKDGKQVWALQTGVPAGQGVAAEGVYYLPQKGGEVCAIDIERGQIRARIRSRNKGEELGNLIFHADHLLSQSATHVAAFPLLRSTLTQIDQALKKNPNDPTALAGRGELRLANGRVQAAIDDLRLALANKPPRELLPRVHFLLYQALDEFFTADFNGAEKKYLDDYRKACQAEDPDETRRRRARFLFLVGTGRERQGKLVEALRFYVQFAELADKGGMIQAPEDRALRVNVRAWIRGRINGLFSRANAEQRKALEAEIQKKWKALLSPRQGKG